MRHGRVCACLCWSSACADSMFFRSFIFPVIKIWNASDEKSHNISAISGKHAKSCRNLCQLGPLWGPVDCQKTWNCQKMHLGWFWSMKHSLQALLLWYFWIWRKIQVGWLVSCYRKETITASWMENLVRLAFTTNMAVKGTTQWHLALSLHD